MNIIQCQFCKKPFASVRGRICPACMEQMDRDFLTVRDYIYENRNSNIDEVSKETEVSKQVIMYLIKEGRLIMNTPDEGGGEGTLVCEVCKKPISTGKMCKDCMGKIASVMEKNVTANKKPQAANVPEKNLKGAAKIGN